MRGCTSLCCPAAARDALRELCWGAALARSCAPTAAGKGCCCAAERAAQLSVLRNWGAPRIAGAAQLTRCWRCLQRMRCKHAAHRDSLPLALPLALPYLLSRVVEVLGRLVPVLQQVVDSKLARLCGSWVRRRRAVLRKGCLGRARGLQLAVKCVEQRAASSVRRAASNARGATHCCRRSASSWACPLRSATAPRPRSAAIGGLPCWRRCAPAARRFFARRCAAPADAVRPARCAAAAQPLLPC